MTDSNKWRTRESAAESRERVAERNRTRRRNPHLEPVRSWTELRVTATAAAMKRPGEQFLEEGELEILCSRSDRNPELRKLLGIRPAYPRYSIPVRQQGSPRLVRWHYIVNGRAICGHTPSSADPRPTRNGAPCLRCTAVVGARYETG